MENGGGDDNDDDDDDDDDDDIDELLLRNGSHKCKSPTFNKQNLNLRRTRV